MTDSFAHVGFDAPHRWKLRQFGLFCMFFLALDALSSYSARRAWPALFEAGRRACGIQF